MSRSGSSLPHERALQHMVGKRIRRQRVEQGLTLATLARLAGVSVAFLSRIETGDRAASLDTLVALCHVLRLRMGDLLAPFDEPVATVVPATHPFVEREVSGLSIQTLSKQGRPSLLMINAVLQGGSRCALRGTGAVTAVQMEGLSFLKLEEGAHVLKCGDALTVTPRALVTWVNQQPRPSRTLWIGTQGVSFGSREA